MNKKLDKLAEIRQRRADRAEEAAAAAEETGASPAIVATGELENDNGGLPADVDAAVDAVVPAAAEFDTNGSDAPLDPLTGAPYTSSSADGDTDGIPTGTQVTADDGTTVIENPDADTPEDLAPAENAPDNPEDDQLGAADLSPETGGIPAEAEDAPAEVAPVEPGDTVAEEAAEDDTADESANETESDNAGDGDEPLKG